jgi:hypothetical protein
MKSAGLSVRLDSGLSLVMANSISGDQEFVTLMLLEPNTGAEIGSSYMSFDTVERVLEREDGTLTLESVCGRTAEWFPPFVDVAERTAVHRRLLAPVVRCHSSDDFERVQRNRRGRD